MLGALGFLFFGALGLLRTRAHPRDAAARRVLRLPAAAAHRVAVGADRVPARVRRGAAALQRAGQRPVGRRGRSTPLRPCSSRCSPGRAGWRPFGPDGGAVGPRGARAPSGATGAGSRLRHGPRGHDRPRRRRGARAHRRRPRARWGDRRATRGAACGCSVASRGRRASWPCCCTFRGPSTSCSRAARSPSFTGGSDGHGSVRPGRAPPVRDRARSAAAPFGWSFLVAAALPLLIARAERHTWAVRGWTVAVASFGIAWARPARHARRPPPAAGGAPRPGGRRPGARRRHGRGGLRGRPSGLPVRVAADRVRAWRRRPSSSRVVPVLGASFDGRWSMPSGDHSRALGFVDDENDEEVVPRAVDR